MYKENTDTEKFKKIGIMGGTFDPPHLGHLILAQRVKESLKLDKIVFIPTGDIYYKDSFETASAEHRLNMTRLSVCDNPDFSVSDIEIKEEGYSYTCDTLKKLKKKLPDAKLYFIVGADSLAYIEKWKNPAQIFESATVVSVGRNGYTSSDLIAKKNELESEFEADVVILDIPNIDISSTEIRKRIRENLSVKYLVPREAEEYIKKNKLYQGGESYD